MVSSLYNSFGTRGAFGRMGDWVFFKSFVEPSWLKMAGRYLWAFAPKCFAPASFLTAGMSIVMASFVLSLGQLGTNLDITKVAMSAGFSLFALIVGLPLVLIGLTKWLFIISAFCRYWLVTDLAELTARQLAERAQDAVKETALRKGYLTKFGLTSALITFVPIFLCFVFGALKLASSSEVMGVMAIALPPPLSAGLGILILSLVALILIFSLAALPVSAVSALPPSKAATWSTLLSARYLLQGILVAVFVTVAGGVISSPESLLEIADPINVLKPPDNLLTVLLTQLWGGATSLLVIPASIVPFCEMLRAPINASNRSASS